MRATGKMLAAASCIFVLLRLCSAEGLNCSVLQDHEQTTYIIYDVGRVLDQNASDCEHVWADASDVSISYYRDKFAPVKTRGVDMYVNLGCLEKVVFTRNCVSEGIEHKVNCITTCRGSASPHVDQGKAPVSWIPPVVIVLVLAVLAVLFTVLYCKFKEKFHRRWNCCQVGGLYTSVKFTSKATECIDVEAGNK